MITGPDDFDGHSSHQVTGYLLLLQQFLGIIAKRFVYIRRNWKGLFSQILLPGFFVCVAMTVALTAPQIQDLPPIVLSPAQYYNYTQPSGNKIPYWVNVADQPPKSWSGDSGPQELAKTFHMPSGVGATCVLKSPWNNSEDLDHWNWNNFTHRVFDPFREYFEPACQSVFVNGVPLSNFVPPVPTPAPEIPSGNSRNGSSSHIGQYVLVEILLGYMYVHVYMGTWVYCEEIQSLHFKQNNRFWDVECGIL